MKSEKGRDEIARSLFEAVKSYAAYVKGTQEADEAPAQEAAECGDAAERPAVVSAEGAEKRPAEEYAVQVLASAERVALSSSRFKKYRNGVREYASDGRFRYKYCVGPYADRDAAQRKLEEVRRTFPDAFVVRCAEGRIVQQ